MVKDNTNIAKIKQRILGTITKISRKDKNGKEFKGIVTRQDILELLNEHGDFKKEKENVEAFLDSLPEEVLDYSKKQAILNDLDSYKVNYKR